MGVHQSSVFTTAILGSPVVTNTETVIATLPPLNLPIDNAAVLIFGIVNIALATGTTSGAFRIRRGTTTAGTQVNAATSATETASTTIFQSVMYVDTPGIVAGQQYSITFQSVGAGANHTVNDVFMCAFVL